MRRCLKTVMLCSCGWAAAHCTCLAQRLAKCLDKMRCRVFSEERSVNNFAQGLIIPRMRHGIFLLLVVGWVSLTLTSPAAAQADAFSSWLQALRAEALQQGRQPHTLDVALNGLRPLPRVIELDRKQPEVTLTYAQYIQRVLPAKRIQHGKKLLRQHHTLLAKIGAAYGVPPRFIVALWGLETDYGQVTGGFPVIAALATLAYDGRRGAFFRRELLYALQIVEAGHITPKTMVGSWAGAMGQSQFMPSSFASYAVDYDGDGRRDIWTTLGDVFASIANYLAHAGWRQSETWGRRVTIPADLDPASSGLKVRQPLSAWQALGVRRADGSDLPKASLQAALVLPAGSQGPAFLVYQNFRTILKWNRSTYFALAVGQLADRIRRGNETQ